MDAISRRTVVSTGVALLGAPRAAAAAKLAFAVFRNGVRVGEHEMTFSGADEDVAVRTEVSLVVKLGPVPVYRYAHQALERWRGGRFFSLTTTTNGNGRLQRVEARRAPDAVLIDAGGAQIRAPAAAVPLTHWKAAALSGPLFNPQEGKLLRLTARRGATEPVRLASGEAIAATRWSLRGESQIDNWYDQGGVWAALRGRLPDGSTMEYRRL
ncbi:MAG: hypothetical protein C0481_05635 [Phenylobacterium sp.]|uniref:DUF6134 family protein n=1 Tax=Phenylobacterium sp. TaxID=1871053 RepID=UPI0025EFAE5D|nr:DUF6134 family protein [Phenylobacterium sp.]MBA4011330.1 hypothetical protein [Phenylobacterium sp.]